MKKIILSSFILVLLVFFVYSDYCGSRSINLTDNTPIIITLRDCSDPDAFSEIYGSSRIISSENSHIGNGTSCPTNLRFCAVARSNTSEYVNITLTRFLNGSETIETITREVRIDPETKINRTCFNETKSASVGQVWIMRSNSSFYDSDEGELKESDVSEVHATIVDCYDPDYCNLHISTESRTCVDGFINFKGKVTKTRGSGISAYSGARIFLGDEEVTETNSSGWYEFSTIAETRTYLITASTSDCGSDTISYSISTEDLEECVSSTKILNYNITEVICHPPICIADLIFNVYDNETREPIEGVFVQISTIGDDTYIPNFSNSEGKVLFLEVPYIFGENNSFVISSPEESIPFSNGYTNVIVGTINISSDESSEDSCMVPCFLCRVIGYEGCDPTCDLGIGFDCCCNYCDPDELVCVECFGEGMICTSTECCEGLDCIGGECIYCTPNLPCEDNYDCCGGTCYDGTCYGCASPDCLDEEELNEDEDPNNIISPIEDDESWLDSILWLWDEGPLIGEYDEDGFLNINFSLRSGCSGLFIIIDNWIFCDLLWILLLILSLIAAYKYKEYPLKKKISLIVFIIPIGIGFLTYVWIGIIAAIFEIVLALVHPIEDEKIK